MTSKPISPRTESEYRRALTHCFGEGLPSGPVKIDLSGVTPSRMTVIKSAVRWALDRDDARCASILASLPQLPWSVKRAVEIPAEAEMLKYEQATSALPIGRRELALLPLRMGLRASEVTGLQRRAVQRAAEHGELVVLRKGGKEAKLPASHCVELFSGLLETVKLQANSTFGTVRGSAWSTAGEILSSGLPISQYHALRSLVRSTGKQAGLEGLRPHKLRHAFATRMMKKGAPLSVVQWMLGHADVKTTLLYVHPSAEDAVKYL